MASLVEHGAEGVEVTVDNGGPNRASPHQQVEGTTSRFGDVEMNVIPNSNVTNSNSQCFCQVERNPILHRPSNHLLEGEMKHSYRKERLTLYTAALNGDWRSAESIIKKDRTFLNSSITDDYKTALHIAAGAKQTAFVKKLVNLIENQESSLELQDGNVNTAFCLAVIAGSVPIAKILMRKVPELALIRGGENSTPLFIAVIFGRHDMARLLYRATESHLNHLELAHLQDIFFTCIETDMFDIAIELLKQYPDLAVARKRDGRTALHMLARKPSAFAGKNPGRLKMLLSSCKGSKHITALALVRSHWTNVLSRTNLDVQNEIGDPFNLLFEAAELGNYEFLAELLRLYPELVWETDDENQTIFHIAVLHRHVDIFNQIYSIGSIKDVVVTYKIPGEECVDWDNMLHLAAKLPLHPHRLDMVSGAALQMQRELLWFEEVKSVVQPSDRERKGLQGLTPRKLFSSEHEVLLEKAEKWMRDTSTSCTIVATLITTVVYSAGFSIPGGNDSTKGTPVMINHTLFHVYAVSEAVALSFSITSTLMFLCILTSRYAEKDFLKSLPWKLMAGLATLFISMMAMIVAFSAAFFLAYRDSYNHHRLRWVPLLVSTFAFLPAALFVFLQYPLLRDIFHSTCCSRSLFRPRKSMFCSKV